jgi:hypothetical protein
MSNIFDYDGPAYISAFAEIMYRIEYIQDNQVESLPKERKLLNSFYNLLNRSNSRSRSSSRSSSRSNSRSITRKSKGKNRNKINRKKKTIKRLR